MLTSASHPHTRCSESSGGPRQPPFISTSHRFRRAAWGHPQLPSPGKSEGASSWLSLSCSTFTHNMLAFGLNKKLCNDFLKKQAVIGNLDEGERRPAAASALPRPTPRIAATSMRNMVLVCRARLPLLYSCLPTCMGHFSLYLEGRFCYVAFASVGCCRLGSGSLPVPVFPNRAKGKDGTGCSDSKLENGQAPTLSCPSF